MIEMENESGREIKSTKTQVRIRAHPPNRPTSVCFIRCELAQYLSLTSEKTIEAYSVVDRDNKRLVYRFDKSSVTWNKFFTIRQCFCHLSQKEQRSIMPVLLCIRQSLVRYHAIIFLLLLDTNLLPVNHHLLTLLLCWCNKGNHPIWCWAHEWRPVVGASYFPKIPVGCSREDDASW